MTHRVRPPAVAGLFYPGSPRALAADIERYLHLAGPGAASTGPAPKALIVPHAGYVYSGPIAASAYARLPALRGTVRRVVLLGPAHRSYVRGLALPAADAFDTPLGQVPVDEAGVRAVIGLPQVCVDEAAHAQEHALEVQLPFLQVALGEFSVVPFAVGAADAQAVAEVLERLWGGSETLLVVSSDLSHYQPYALARSTDRRTAGAILALEAGLDHDQACGAAPINGLLLCARRRGLEPALLDLRNSGDTAGDRSRVVGYAAFAFAPKEAVQ